MNLEIAFTSRAHQAVAEAVRVQQQPVHVVSIRIINQPITRVALIWRAVN